MTKQVSAVRRPALGLLTELIDPLHTNQGGDSSVFGSNDGKWMVTAGT